MKNTSLLTCLIILCSFPGFVSSNGSSHSFQSAATSNSQTESGGKEVTILVDHYRPPCIDRLGPQLCYLVASPERPTEFPYFYGDIEGFKFQWGHEYRLLALQEESPQSAASRYIYRVIKILSDKKVRPQKTFSLPLKAPLSPPFFRVDESSNIYLLGEVKITAINAKLKARLLKLLETAASMDSISGRFKHDQKRENVITLFDLSHERR